MEVHAHSHTHGKKNWKSYFWEFLMLFLAVFCGFLAENKREHIVEHKRTKLYAQQFYEELKLDTISLARSLKRTGSEYAYHDTLIAVLKTGLAGDKDWKNLYYASFNIDIYNTITFHNASFEQIKNSGSLRNFTNKPLVDAIQEYINKKDHVESFQTSLVNYYDTRLTPFVDANFDKELLYYNYAVPNRHRFDSLWDKSSQPTIFLSGNKNAATQLKNMAITIMDSYVSELGRQYSILLDKSNHLIEILKEEYHLE